MKQILTLTVLAAFVLSLTGCVTRTYTDNPQKRGSKATSGLGSSGEVKETSKKRVWFWQDEFRNP